MIASGAALGVLALLGSGPPGAQAPQFAYDLRPGDHLVYRETFEWDIDGRSFGIPPSPEKRHASLQLQGRLEATNHVLVLAGDGSGVTLGIQRNRERAELLRDMVDGVDALAKDRASNPGLLEPASFVEVNRVSPSGHLLLPRGIFREWGSKVLWDAFEVQPVPGDSTAGNDPLGLRQRAVTPDSVAGEACLRVERAGNGSLFLPRSTDFEDGLRLSYWFCPASGVIRRVEFDAIYPDIGFERVHEHTVVELLDRRRGEALGDWLANKDLQRGALAGLEVTDRIALTANDLLSAAGSGDTNARRSAWIVAHRFGLDSAVLAAQPANPDPPRAPPPAPAPSLACGGSDSLWKSSFAAKRFRGQVPGTTLRAMTSPGFEGWPYAIRVPEDYHTDRPAPLLIYLAGNAGPAIEAAMIARKAVAGSDFLVLYPHAAAYWWIPGPTAMMNALLDEVLRSYNVDFNRIYLTGVSNGGSGTFYYATLWPHRFTAAASAMGAGIYLPGEPGEGAPLPENTGNIPLLFLHGEADRIISPMSTHLTVKLLQTFPRQAPLETFFYKDRGHELGLGEGDKGRTLEFFSRQTGRRFPTRVHIASRTLRYPRQYWVRIDERDGSLPPDLLMTVDPAEVDATIKPDGTIQLQTQNVRRLSLLLRPELLPRSGTVRVLVNGKEAFRGPLPSDCATLTQSLEESPDPFLAYTARLEITVPGAK